MSEAAAVPEQSEVADGVYDKSAWVQAFVSRRAFHASPFETSLKDGEQLYLNVCKIDAPNAVKNDMLQNIVDNAHRSVNATTLMRNAQEFVERWSKVTL